MQTGSNDHISATTSVVRVGRFGLSVLSSCSIPMSIDAVHHKSSTEQSRPAHRLSPAGLYGAAVGGGAAGGGRGGAGGG